MCWGFFLLSLVIQAQDKEQKFIRITNADSLVFDQNNSQYRRLIGNIGIEHNGSTINCDSAYILIDNNFFHGYGNVVINQGDSIKAYGEEVKYKGNEKSGILSQNARLFQDDSKIYSENIYFDQNQNIAYWLDFGKIIRENSTLTSKKGYFYTQRDYFIFSDSLVLIDEGYLLYSDTLGYNPNTKTADIFGPTTIINEGDTIYSEWGTFNSDTQIGTFENNVVITSDNQKLYADSVYFNQADSIGHAIGNVKIKEINNDVWIYGEKAFQNHAENTGVIEGEPLMIQIFDGDSLFLHADTFKIEQIENHKEIYAYPAVKFFKTDMQGACDSLHFSPNDSLIKMLGEPIIWSEKNQITGDTIFIETYDSEIKHLFVFEHAFMIEEVDSIRYSQIKGKTMTANFIEGKINQILFKGNGETNYWALDEEDLLIGINQSKCSSIRIKMKENEIQTISFLEKPSSIFSPPLSTPVGDLLLKDFIWHSQKRPASKEDIFK